MILYSTRRLAALALLLAFVVPQPAHAYIGPGASLGAIAVTIAIALGFVLLLAGFVWYPLKRLLKSRKAEASRRETGSPE